MSELRLYCDLLVQQVGKTKEVTTTGASSSEVKYYCSQPPAKSHPTLLIGDAYSHFIPESWILLFFRENKIKFNRENRYVHFSLWMHTAFLPRMNSGLTK